MSESEINGYKDRRTQRDVEKGMNFFIGNPITAMVVDCLQAYVGKRSVMDSKNLFDLDWDTLRTNKKYRRLDYKMPDLNENNWTVVVN